MIQPTNRYVLFSILIIASLTVVPVIQTPVYAVEPDTNTLQRKYQEARRAFSQQNYNKTREILENILQSSPPENLRRKMNYLMGITLKNQNKYPVQALKYFNKVYSDTITDNLTDDALFYTAQILKNNFEQTQAALPYLGTIREHFQEEDYYDNAIEMMETIDTESVRGPEQYPLSDIPPPKIKLNFKDVSLNNFISTYSKLSGKNFLIPDDLTGSITLIGKEGIPLHDLYDVFLNVLESRGYTAIKSDNVYRIERVQQALQSGITTEANQGGLRSEFFNLEDLPWNNVISAINTLLPQSKNLVRMNEFNRILVTATPGDLEQVQRTIDTFRVMQMEKTRTGIIEYEPKNISLSDLSTKFKSIFSNFANQKNYSIITNKTAANLLVVLPSDKKEKALELMNRIDKDADTDTIDGLSIKIFRLEHAKVGNVKQKLTELLKVAPGNFASERVKIVADQRQKALVVSTASETALELIRNTINELDRESKTIPDNIKIFQLEHANENDVSETLKKIKNLLPGEYPGGEIKFIPHERRRAVIVAAESSKVFPIIEDVIDQIDKEDVKQQMSHHVYQVKNSEAGPLAEKLNALFKSGKQKSEKKQLSVSADEQSNSLIISASPQQWSTVKRMLNQLDNPKKQILADIYIAEASKNKTNELGIEWNVEGNISIDGTSRDISVGPEFGLRGDRGSRTDDNNGSISGNLFGFNAGLFNAGGDQLQGLLHALDQDENFNLMSSSHLVANENEKASLSVGQIVPLKTQEQQSTSGQSNVVNSFEFKDVGIQLELTPTLGSDSNVTLDMEQQIEEILPDQGAGQGLPVRRTRDIKTKVDVPHQETLVLGGIIESQQDNSYQTVPILGQIPYLKWLFTNQRETTQRRNLLMFLQPKIISSDNNLDEATRDLNKQRLNQTSLEKRIEQLQNQLSETTEGN